MKYIYIVTLIFIVLGLSSCFEKSPEQGEGTTPVVSEEIQDEVSEEDVSEELIENDTSVEEVVVDGDVNDEDESIIDEEEAEAGAEVEVQTEVSTDVDIDGEVATEDEEVIIEGYEKELEELFQDILGE